MKNIILLVVLVFCVPSQASVVGSLFKAIKKGADEVPTSAKKADSETINGKKEDAVTKDIDKDLADDLAFIESRNFRFSPDDVLKGGDDLSNAFSPMPPSQEFINFSNWLKIQMAASPFRAWARDITDQANKELIDSDSNEAVTDSSDDSPTVEQLHELISQELKETSDIDHYGESLAKYLSRLTAYGWEGFHPFRDYDKTKLKEASFFLNFWVEAQSLSLMTASGFETAQQEEWIRRVLSGMSSSNHPLELATYLGGCTALINESPNAFGAMYPDIKKIKDDLCTSERLISVSKKILPSLGDSENDHLGIESILLSGLAQSGALYAYYPLRDKLLSKVPMLLGTDEYSDLAEEILSMVALSEISVGNFRNAYDISLLLQYEFGQDPGTRNWVLGYLMPAIFIEVRDLVMTGKLLRIVEPMADDQSDFFIAAESKINLLTVMINYARLRKEQSI